jgi:hypothetical protein
MDKFKNKPKTFFISEEYHADFQKTLNKKLEDLFEDGAEIHEIKSFCNNEYIFALIIYS